MHNKYTHLSTKYNACIEYCSKINYACLGKKVQSFNIITGIRKLGIMMDFP